MSAISREQLRVKAKPRRRSPIGEAYDKRRAIVEAICKQLGASPGSPRRALKARLWAQTERRAVEYTSEEAAEYGEFDPQSDFDFEWDQQFFPFDNVVPACHRLDEDEDGLHIRIYEIGKVTWEKLKIYGDAADLHEYNITLHVFDHIGKEIARLDNEALEQYALAYLYDEQEQLDDTTRDYILLLKNWRSTFAINEAVRHQEPLQVTPSIRTKKPDERAILRAVYDLGLIKEGDQL